MSANIGKEPLLPSYTHITNQPAIILFVLTLNLADIMAPCIALQLEQTNYAHRLAIYIYENRNNNFSSIELHLKRKSIDFNAIY